MAGNGNQPEPQILDLRNATLLDSVQTALCQLGGDRAGETLLAITLGGRINKSQAPSTILYLANEDQAALLATEIIGLASRISPEFFERFNARIRELAESGNLGPGWTGT